MVGKPVIVPPPIHASIALTPRAWRSLCAGLVIFVGIAMPASSQPQLDLPRVQLSAGMFLINAQIASTPRQREIGLMHRTEMPGSEGMLFVFDKPGIQCFWMKNTPLALTAAFVADDGRIVNLADMQPMSERSHCSKEPVRFVLEMNQGWFAKKGIAAGSQLRNQIFLNQ